MSSFLSGIGAEYVRLYPDEAARIFEQLPAEDAQQLVTALPVAECAMLISRINISQSLSWARAMPVEQLLQVAARLPNDFCAVLVRRLPVNLREQIITGLPDHQAGAIRRTLDYPAASIGAIVDPVVLTIMEDNTIEEAISQVRDSLDYQHDHLYVVNRQQQLVGILTLREFIVAQPRQTLRSVMKPAALVLNAASNRHQLIESVLATGYEEIPVTDNTGNLIGVLRKSFALRLGHAPESEQEQKPVSLVLSFAELFWQITAGFLPGGPGKKE